MLRLILPCTAEELGNRPFDSWLEPCQASPLRVRVDLGMLISKGYSNFSPTVVPSRLAPFRNDPPKKSLGPAQTPPHRCRSFLLLLVQMGCGLLCSLWVWRRTNRRPCRPPMSNPSTSPWTARPDGSGRWDNRMAAQHLPRYLGGLAVDKRRTRSKEEETGGSLSSYPRFRAT